MLSRKTGKNSGILSTTNKNKEDNIMSVIHITKENFQEEVLRSDRPVLLDFWAPWCGPCRMVSPVVDAIAAERADIKVGKVNVDEEPELAGQFQVMSIPTLAVMKDGAVVNQAVGARPKSAILAML
jgi:thioredoxin 1